MNTTYEDGVGREFEHPQMAIDNWSDGCDMPHNEEDEESEICCRGTLCEMCAEEVERAKKALERVHEMEEKVWDKAQIAFCARAKDMGYDEDEVYTLTSENRRHGAYMRAHGACSETIFDAYDEDEGTLALHLHDEEIEHLIGAMGGAGSRHEDTDYDEMRACGISRDNAREYVAMGV